jgi:PEP-CTERM motif
MKSLITLLVLLPLPAWAQGVTTFTVQTNIGLSFNGSFTDSISRFEGPGVSLSATGGATCPDFCLGDFFTPGSSLNPSIDFVDFSAGSGTLTLGGQQTNCDLSLECSLRGPPITALGTVTFPTNDQNFTVTVPAVMGPISGQVGPLPFNLLTPPGELVLTFGFFNAPSPSYQFEGGVFSTPEPGTLDLMMAAALVAILGIALKRRKLPALSH